MAPIKDVDGTNTDVQILLVLLSNCGEMDLDSRALAGAFGITRTDNALRKVKQVLTKYDYKLEGGRITRINGGGSGETPAVETPEKTPKKRSKARGTPTSKKQKLNVTDSEEDGGKEQSGAGEADGVKIETEEEVV